MTIAHVYMRGLIVSISFLHGIPEPRVEDVEHSVPRFFHIYMFNVRARGTAGEVIFVCKHNMNNQQEEKLKTLKEKKEEYLATEGIDTLEKKGSAKEKFDQLVDASIECWEEAHSNNATQEDHIEFREKFKETIKTD